MDDNKLTTKTILPSPSKGDAVLEFITYLITQKCADMDKKEKIRINLYNYVLLKLELFPETNIDDIRKEILPIYSKFYDVSSFESWLQSTIDSL